MKKILILLILLLSIPNLVKAGGLTPEYLTFTANQADSKIGFAQIATGATIKYSTDNGSTWTTASTSSSITLTNIGDKVQFKGDYIGANLSYNSYTQFNISSNVSVSGDINTLIDGVGGEDITLKDKIYYKLFNGCTGLTDASKLKLPSKTLATSCYESMFEGCSSLTKAPELPATTLAEGCYQGMFIDCTSLTTAPVLTRSTENYCFKEMFKGCTKLNTIEVNFNSWNFDLDFTKDWVDGVAASGIFICPDVLTKEFGTSRIPKGWVVPEYLTFTSNQDGSTIGFTKIAEGAKIQYNIGDGWTSATTSTSITLNKDESVKFKGDYRNATTSGTNFTQFTITGKVSASGDINTLIDDVGGDIELKEKNYFGLFKSCTGLTDASQLKLLSTTLAIGCYNEMFSGCSGLTTAPELPATNLADYCYSSMFYGCSSLTTAPELPATTLKLDCYGAMFRGCTSLNKISVNFTDWNTSSTSNWVDGVASKGTFICPDALTKEFGTSRIPNGWVVPEYLTFTANENSTIGFNQIADGAKIEYNDGTGWKYASNLVNNNPLTLNSGKSVKFKGDYSNATINTTTFTKFSISGNVSVSGDINTLIDGVGGEDITLKDYIYNYLFNDCTGLTDASNLKLPSTTLAESCYKSMFGGCSSLTTAPELPATTLADNCYDYMYSGCSKLTTAPELPAKSLAEECYYGMFFNCRSLTTAPELPATTLKLDCYGAMFNGCSSLNKIEVNFTDWNNEKSTSNWVDGVAASGIFICPDALTKDYGINNIPNGWTVKHPEYLTFTANQDGSKIGFEKIYNQVKLEYNLGSGWFDASELIAEPLTLNKGDVVKFRGNNPNGLNNQNNHNLSSDTQFNITGDVSASGDINSLMNNYGGDIQLTDNNYCGLFQGCLGLTDVSKLILSSKSGSFSYNCYASMFEGCSNIFSTPEISAINGPGGASNMFKDCSSLFMVKVDNCLDAFKNDFAINWLSGVAETGVFNCKEIDQVSDIKREVNYIPEGWYVNPLFIVLNEDNIDDGLSLSESKYYTEDFGKLCDEFFLKTQGMKAEEIYSMDEEIKVKYDNYRIDKIVEDSNHPKVSGPQFDVNYDKTEFTFKVSDLKYPLSKITIIGTPLYQVKYYSKDIELCVEKDQNTPIKFDNTSKLSDLKSSSIDGCYPEIYTDAECTKELGEDELLVSYCDKGLVKLYKKPIEYTITLGENVTCSTTKATIETPAINFSLANKEDEQLKIKSVFINTTDVTNSIKDYAGSFNISDYLTDVTIKVEYKQKGYEVIINSDDIINLSTNLATEGEEVTFSVKEKEYQVPVVMINGEEISSDNLDYKFIMSNKPAEISVVYSEIKIEELSLENSQETACAGNKLTVNISVTDNAKYYSIIFADELINQGFENVDFIELTSSKVTLTIPTTAVSGEYEASFVAKSKNGVVSKPQALKFKVAYPTDIIKIKFGDVICIDNSSKQFVGYQWIKDGKEIPGATEQFYCETPKLTGVYSIKLTKKDGTIIETCSLNMSNNNSAKSFSKNINVYPNPAKYGEPIYINLEDYNELELSKSRIEIYDLKGGLILKESNLSEINQITLPKGFYNGALILDGRKYSFKVVVK